MKIDPYFYHYFFSFPPFERQWGKKNRKRLGNDDKIRYLCAVKPHIHGKTTFNRWLWNESLFEVEVSLAVMKNFDLMQVMMWVRLREYV